MQTYSYYNSTPIGYEDLCRNNILHIGITGADHHPPWGVD